eukprot:6279972-Amphidinium_carterae.1
MLGLVWGPCSGAVSPLSGTGTRFACLFRMHKTSPYAACHFGQASPRGPLYLCERVICQSVSACTFVFPRGVASSQQTRSWLRSCPSQNTLLCVLFSAAVQNTITGPICLPCTAPKIR